MIGEGALALTVLSGTSTTAREDVLRCLVLRNPGLMAVDYRLDPAGPGPARRVVWTHAGTVEDVPVGEHGCCLSCAVRDDLEGLIPAVAARAPEGCVVALPTAVTAGPVLVALDAAACPAGTVATVVDAPLLLAHLSGDDLLADRGLAAAPSDRRSTAEVMAEHVEHADILAVVGLDRMATDDARQADALLAHLNPLAARVTVGPGGTGSDALRPAVPSGTRPAPSERRLLVRLAADLCEPACGVVTVVWSSDAPLHSGRLREALPGVVDAVLRSSGQLWLADRPDRCVGWQQAGGSLAFSDPLPWTGPPGCQLVLTGLGTGTDRVAAVLDSCVASDDERRRPCWPDPFGEALGPADQPAA